MTIRYIDLVGGNNANNGTTTSTPKKDLNNITGSTIVAGDLIKFKASPLPQSLGIDLTFTNQSGTVTAASALTETLYKEGAWTAATNVTCSTSTDRKFGATSAQMVVASGFTTGKAAYYALGSTKDLSSYQQLMFWIKPSSGQIATSTQFKLKTCSDTTGDTPVDSAALTTLAPNANGWCPVVVDLGSAMGSSIQSIAVYFDADPGSLTFFISGVWAALPSSNNNAVTLWDLIGKNDNDDWWPIRSFDGTTWTLDVPIHRSRAPSTPRGYYGTTATVTGYRKRPIVLDTPFTSSTANHNGTLYAGSNSGSSGSPITFSGGWSDDYSTQVGDTLIHALNCGGVFCHPSSSRNFLTWENFGVVGGMGFINTFGSEIGSNVTYRKMKCMPIGTNTSTECVFTTAVNEEFYECTIIGGQGAIWNTNNSGAAVVIDSCRILSGTGIGIVDCRDYDAGIAACSIKDSLFANNSVSLQVTAYQIVDGLEVRYSSTTGLLLVYCTDVRNLTIANCSSFGLIAQGGTSIAGLTTSGNSTAGVSLGSNGLITIWNANMSDTTKISTSVSSSGAAQVILENPSHNSGNWEQYFYNGKIELQSSVAPAGLSKSIKFSPILATTRSASSGLGRCGPRPFSIPILCKADVDNDITMQFKRSDANLSGQMRVPKGRYPGITSEITVAIDPAVDNTSGTTGWETRTITVHPDEDCVVDVFIEWWHDGTTTYNGYVAGPVEVDES